MADKAYDPFANQEEVTPTENSTSDGADLASTLLSGAADIGEPPNASREHALANGFDDPSSLFSITESSSPPLMQETLEAVQDLVAESQVAPSYENNNADPMATLQGMNEVSTHVWSAKSQMADKMFSLVLCDYKFEVLVEKILEVVMETVDAQAGSILELDVANKEYFFRSTIGGGDQSKVKTFRVPCNKGIVGHVAESKTTVLLNDLDEGGMELKSISLATGFETKSCLAAPIMIANQLYGVIEVFNRRGIHYFDNNDKLLLEDGIKMAAKVLEVRFFSAMLWNRTKIKGT